MAAVLEYRVKDAGTNPAAEPPCGAQAITHCPVDALIPYARNTRTHSEAQVALIAGAIREFGFNNPVLVDGETGHCTPARLPTA